MRSSHKAPEGNFGVGKGKARLHEQRRGQHDPTGAARFDRVLHKIRAQIEYIAPHAEAERARAAHRKEMKELHLARTQANWQKRLAQRKANDPNKFSLMRLPYTIRLQILNLAIEPIQRPVFHRPRRSKKRTNQKTFPIQLPPIARARDSRLRLEAIMVLLEKSTIEIRSGPANEGIQKWLSSLDFTALEGDSSYQTGFDAVRALRFSMFSKFPFRNLEKEAPNNDILLMNKCKNLSSAYLTFYTEDIGNEVNGYEGVYWCRREYRLDGLLELKGLKYLSIREDDTNDDLPIGGWSGPSSVESMKKWFKGEFKQRGVSVEVPDVR